MDPSFFNRYQRQIQLRQIGLQGQQKLSEARVLIVGMGGLGCPAAQYLVGAGIGKIGLADGDNIELHNLHRQVLFNTSDVGERKTQVAQQKLAALNPTVEFHVFDEFISPQNVLSIAADFDIILDGSDRFETRYLLDNYCTLKNKVYVYGSVFEFEGQVALFDFQANNISYNSLFLPSNNHDANKPSQSSVPTCSENGILGFLPGIIGNMQALEVVKHICGLTESNDFELIHYNALAQSIYKTTAQPNKDFQPPRSEQDILSFDYNDICN